MTSLLTPSPFKRIAADPRHPWFKGEAALTTTVVMFNGRPFEGPIFKALAGPNGYLQVQRRGSDGLPEIITMKNGINRYRLVIIKGDVQLFMTPERKDKQ